MFTAAVFTAGVTFLAMLVVMVITVNIGVVAQTSAEQCVHRSVSVPADTAVELDTCFGESACAPPPMPPQIKVSTPFYIRKPASAP